MSATSILDPRILAKAPTGVAVFGVPGVILRLEAAARAAGTRRGLIDSCDAPFGAIEASPNQIMSDLRSVAIDPVAAFQIGADLDDVCAASRRGDAEFNRG